MKSVVNVGQKHRCTDPGNKKIKEFFPPEKKVTTEGLKKRKPVDPPGALPSYNNNFLHEHKHYKPLVTTNENHSPFPLPTIANPKHSNSADRTKFCNYASGCVGGLGTQFNDQPECSDTSDDSISNYDSEDSDYDSEVDDILWWDSEDDCSSGE